MEAAIFSMTDLFGTSGDSDCDEEAPAAGEDCSTSQFVENEHHLAGQTVTIREFDFHPVNANLVWPGTASFADWLLANRKLVEGKEILEIGSGTGILAIFLTRALGSKVTTSDYDDAEIEENIAHNFRRNGLEPAPHIRHTWGTPLEAPEHKWEVLVASDILLYVKQYNNLICSLRYLLTNGGTEKESGISSDDGCTRSNDCHRPGASADSNVDLLVDAERIPRPFFLMSWRRRIPKEDEAHFFEGCRTAGLFVADVGPRIYCITAKPWRD